MKDLGASMDMQMKEPRVTDAQSMGSSGTQLQVKALAKHDMVTQAKGADASPQHRSPTLLVEDMPHG